MLTDYLMEQGFQKQREVAGLASYRKDRPFSEGEGTSEGMEESGDIVGSFQLTLILLMIR